MDCWSWFVEGEYGSVQWNPAENRMELFVGTTLAAYAAAKPVLQLAVK